jgi:hypothetical protein
MQVTYTGDPGLTSALASLLQAEGLQVVHEEDPSGQAGGPEPVQIYEVELPGVPAWATTLASVQAAAAKFLEQYPHCAGKIVVQGGNTDRNTPNKPLASHR